MHENSWAFGTVPHQSIYLLVERTCVMHIKIWYYNLCTGAQIRPPWHFQFKAIFLGNVNRTTFPYLYIILLQYGSNLFARLPPHHYMVTLGYNFVGSRFSTFFQKKKKLLVCAKKPMFISVLAKKRLTRLAHWAGKRFRS